MRGEVEGTRDVQREAPEGGHDNGGASRVVQGDCGTPQGTQEPGCERDEEGGAREGGDLPAGGGQEEDEGHQGLGV